MRKIDDELIRKIEKAFGLSLYDWQKSYLKDESGFISGRRGNGKTFTICLKTLITNERTIKRSELRKFVEGFNLRRKQAEEFVSEILRINKILEENGIETVLED